MYVLLYVLSNKHPICKKKLCGYWQRLEIYDSFLTTLFNYYIIDTYVIIFNTLMAKIIIVKCANK